MKKLKPHHLHHIRRIDADPTKVKNARLRRLKIQRLKLNYTCEEGSKILNGQDDNNEGKKVHESMQISLSLTTKEEFKKEDSIRSILSYGWVSLIGRRKEMEDEVSVEVGKDEGCDFFGVYDGHGGAQVAALCKERMYRLLAEEVGRCGGGGGEVDWEGVMEGCFGKMDGEVAGNAAMRTVGSTAVVAVVGKDEVVVANCGDSRAVLGRGGQAFALSNDHKPDRPDELMRIEAAGGRVINWNGQRVLGVLATSRSIGDQYLRPYVISKPEVTVTKRTNKDEFLILASDGLWDVISNEDACALVRKCLSGQVKRRNNNSSELRQNQSPAGEAAALLANLAMAKGSRDNTSVIVVELRRSDNNNN